MKIHDGFVGTSLRYIDHRNLQINAPSIFVPKYGFCHQQVRWSSIFIFKHTTEMHSSTSPRSPSSVPLLLAKNTSTETWKFVWHFFLQPPDRLRRANLTRDGLVRFRATLFQRSDFLNMCKRTTHNDCALGGRMAVHSPVSSPAPSLVAFLTSLTRANMCGAKVASSPKRSS